MKMSGLGAMTSSTIIAGMMRIGDKTDEEIRGHYCAARDAGITTFDHADIYGGTPHACETRFRDALRLSDTERAEIILQTKCGIVPGSPGYYDLSYEHIVSSVHASLEALGTGYIDVLLLHRPDALADGEEVARAVAELTDAGKVRSVGVSNHTPGQIEYLARYLDQPIVANQLQLSLTHAPIIAQPIAANTPGTDQSIVRDGGVLEYCRTANIRVQAWSPLQAGRSPGTFFNPETYPELVSTIDRLARRYGVAPEAIAIAWITRHPADIQVVLGTTNPARLRACAAGANITLTRPEWYELFAAAGHLIP